MLYCCQVACRELGEDFQTSIPVNRPALSLWKSAHGHSLDGVLQVTPEAAPGEDTLLGVNEGWKNRLERWKEGWGKERGRDLKKESEIVAKMVAMNPPK